MDIKEKDLSAPNVPKRISDLEKNVEILNDTVYFSIIAPELGCSNPDCSAKERNLFEIEVVCKVCGTKRMQEVNWQFGKKEDEDED